MTLRVYLVDGPDCLYEGMFENIAGYENTKDHSKADILCYLGGADVNPKFYGEEKLPCTTVSNRADEVCLKFWNMYPEKPKVGICRGGQFLNVMSGGEMWQDVDQHTQNHVLTNLLPIEGTHYQQGTEVLVTSTHHQMMRPHSEYGEEIAITRRATRFVSANDVPVPDHDTEVVWYEHTKCLCFQPHPEFTHTYSCLAYFSALMHYFFGGAK